MSGIVGVLVLGWIIRSLVAKGGAETHARPSAPKRLRRGMMFEYFIQLMLRVIAMTIVYAWFIDPYGSAAPMDVLMLALGYACVVLLARPSVAFPLLVRLGNPYAAYYFTRALTPFRMRTSLRAGASVIALRALLHRGQAADVELAHIESRFRSDGAPDDTRFLCHALLAELRGDRAGMRDALHAIVAFDMPSSVFHRSTRWVRRYAIDLLVADAIERDDFDGLDYLARYARDGFVRCVARIGARLRRTSDASSDLTLCCSFIVSRHPILLWPVLRRALATPRVARVETTVPASDEEILSRALQLDQIGDTDLRYREVCTLLAAWERKSAAEEFTPLREQLEARLVRAAQAAFPVLVSVPRGRDEPFLLHDLREVALDDAFGALRDLCADFPAQQRRASEDAVFRCAVVWARTLRIWRDIARSDDTSRRAAYDAVRVPFWDTAVALLDDDHDPFVTHSVFSRLLEEARALGVANDLAPLDRNKRRCG